MNLKIIEKALLPLILATLFIIVFNWQFIASYAYFIEYFREEKLSTLYAHLFIYSFLSFTIFLFLMNLLNQLIQSKVFIGTISVMIFAFYGLSYEVLYAPIKYFIEYPLSINGLSLMVLFIVSSFIYGVYSLMSILFKYFVPFSHSFIFLLFSLGYSAWFINLYCYPISTILTKFSR
ncbi:MAG: Unknown protein [uncultured Sulfurovum sp.]|uniref:Uncharacterized protein n=1 Tax=uncultured Sulfurovum sp. TaxID=269237 RepID=A0A6S6SDN8_9BACT|nr:MAG: Unknown protein [uncultured Sulfurovum sp.]